MILTFQTLQVPIRDFVREFMLDSSNRNWLNKCSKNPSACVQALPKPESTEKPPLAPDFSPPEALVNRVVEKIIADRRAQQPEPKSANLDEQTVSQIVKYGTGDTSKVNEDSLTNPVRDFIREYVGANGNSDWIRECVNGQRICTELLGFMTGSHRGSGGFNSAKNGN